MNNKNTQLVITAGDFPCRIGLETFYQRNHSFEHIHTCTTQEETFHALNQIKYTDQVLVLITCKITEGSGLELCYRIKNRYKQAKVLLIGDEQSMSCLYKSSQYLADGFICRDEPDANFLQAVEQIMVRQSSYYSNISKALLFDYEHSQQTQQNGLTPRELQVLEFIANGYSSKQIADKLGRHETTIDKHRQNIMNKTGIRKITDLVRYAIKTGVVTIE